MTNQVTVTVNEKLVISVADETSADRRSVTKRLAGLPVRGAAGRAIDRALAARGFLGHT